MSDRQYGYTISIRRTLPRTLTWLYKRARGNLAVAGGLFREAAAFKMSSSKEAARAINRLASEGFDLLGTSDGSALYDFVEEYLCGDDPDNYDDELSSGKVPLLY